jgi:hypothetical protein
VKRLALVLMLSAFAGVVPAQAAAPLARVQVVAVDFQYRLSRTRVRSGPVRIELVNLGEDEHDLRIQRIGGTKVYGMPGTLSGDRHVLTTRLRPGVYRLWCAMADHQMRGMTARLTVLPPKPRH